MRRRNPQRHPEPTSRQAGYTLPELAICICILGLLLGGGITDTARYFAKRKSDETHRRIDLVMNELSAYVQTHNRLPFIIIPLEFSQAFGYPVYRLRKFKQRLNNF